MKRQITKLITSTLVLGLACVGALTANTNQLLAKVKVSKVSVAAPYSSKAYVAKGKKISLTTNVKVTPNKKANKKVKYKSAKQGIATVSSKGVIKGKKVGKTSVTITSKKNKKKKKIIKVIVLKKAVKKVKLNAKSTTLAVGGKKTLKATISPTKKVSKQIIWKSSNKKVATVSAKGLIKGVGEGTAKITATAADGSKKKATCKVTVGAGIASVTVPHSRVVKVKLSCAKKLTAANFDIRDKIIKTGKYTDASKRVVESIKTSDNINYDVYLSENTVAYDNSYLKVTISALVTNKTKEIYITTIPGYGDAGTNSISYVDGYSVGDTYDEYWDVYNSNTIGPMCYSVTGLPAGLTAYISEDKTSIRVSGIFKSVLNGATATLTGVDEAGKKYTRQYKFYVSDGKSIVVGIEPLTTLSYTPDNESTPAVDEESGSRLYEDGDIYIRHKGNYIDSYSLNEYIHISGGETGKVQLEYDFSSIKLYDEKNNRLAIGPGTYNVKVTATASSNSNLKKVFNFPIKLVAGVIVSGKVKDAAGQIAPYVSISGSTRSNAYGRRQYLYAVSETDGTYSARVIPGDYYVYSDAGNDDNYYNSIGNIFNKNIVKDITIPLYKVSFTTTIPGAVAYELYSGNLGLYDSYGNRQYIRRVSDDYSTNYGKLYAYLKKGKYTLVPSGSNSDDNVVKGYSKLESQYDSDMKKTYYYLNSSNPIKQNNLSYFKISGTFTVTGNNTIKLTATPFDIDSLYS